MLITDHPLNSQHTSEHLSGHWVVGVVPASCHCCSGIASCRCSRCHLLPMSGHTAGRGQLSGLVLEIKGRCAVFTSHLAGTLLCFHIAPQWLILQGYFRKAVFFFFYKVNLTSSWHVVGLVQLQNQHQFSPSVMQIHSKGKWCNRNRKWLRNVEKCYDCSQWKC